MKKILRLNLYSLAFFVISYLLTLLGFSYIQYLAGTILFIIIGLNLSWLVEALNKKILSKNVFAAFSILSSPLVLALGLYAGIILNHGKVSNPLILISAIGTQLVLLALVSLAGLVYKNKNYSTINFLQIAKNRYFWTVSGIVLFLLIGNFILYPFIPEADGYGVMIKLSSIIEQGSLPVDISRVLFYIITLGINSLTNIPIYWVFKLFYPLLASTIFLPFYFISKEKFSDSKLKYLIAVLPLCMPVVVMEILYARPQLIFIIFFVLVLYVASELYRSSDRNYYIPVLLLLMSVIGIKCHEFFIFTTILILIFLFIYCFPLIKKRPLESVALLLAAVVGIFPWARELGMIEQIAYYGKIFSNAFQNVHPNLWFIDSYINTDGNQMGWPGITSLFYYGYNLGLIFPVIVLMLLIRKKKLVLNLKENWLYFTAFLMFFSIAELFPRIGLAFLPDRAWLLVSLALCFLMPSMVKNAFKGISWAAIKVWSMTLITISFIISWGLTYAKQGWVTKNEYDAAAWIKNNTPENSLFISQPSNSIILQYFAKRDMVPADDVNVFTSETFQNKFINNLSSKISTKETLSIEATKTKNGLIENINSLSSDNVDVNRHLNDQISLNLKYFSSLNNKIAMTKTEDEVNGQPLYVLYSEDKFTGLYGSREWWKKLNFCCIKIGELENAYSNSKIYIRKIR